MNASASGIFAYEGESITHAYIYNAGTVGSGPSGSAGIGCNDIDSTIVNAGTVIGMLNGIFVSGSSDTILNSGTMIGSTAVNMVGSLETFTNRGTVEGLVSGGSGNTIQNSGTIDGDVTFGAGTNLYDGRRGSVDGTIIGGLGADTIFAGSDGETIGGGKGHDKLYAGAGADTFVFTSYSSPDYDHISHFDVSKDTIQLGHTVFTHLAADTTPTFAVGSAPSSATDFLYYNSSTGVLAYDPDGSGTKFGGYTVAVLDKGLALAAKDFTVV